MSDELIVQQLKDKEQRLINELDKVRLAIKAFIETNTNFNSISLNGYKNDYLNIPHVYDSALTYQIKILFVLSQAANPMLVDDITDQIHAYEAELDINKLHKSIGHNVSMLVKYGKVKKHPFNRKIKYSIVQ